LLPTPSGKQNLGNICNSLEFGRFQCREIMQLAEGGEYSRSAARGYSIINKLLTVDVGLSEDHRISGREPALNFCLKTNSFGIYFQSFDARKKLFSPLTGRVIERGLSWHSARAGKFIFRVCELRRSDARLRGTIVRGDKKSIW
jgi:hypothetical protein